MTCKHKFAAIIVFAIVLGTSGAALASPHHTNSDRQAAKIFSDVLDIIVNIDSSRHNIAEARPELPPKPPALRDGNRPPMPPRDGKRPPMSPDWKPDSNRRMPPPPKDTHESYKHLPPRYPMAKR